MQRRSSSIAMHKSVESERLQHAQPLPSFVGSPGVLLYMRLYDLAGSSALESRKSLDLLKLKKLSHGSYLSQPDSPFPSFFWHKPVCKHAWRPLKQERRSRWSSQTLEQNLQDSKFGGICFLYLYSELTETRALSLVTLGRESKHARPLKLEFRSRTQRPASCWEVDTRGTLEANCDCIISKFPKRNIGPQPTDLLNLWTSTRLIPTGISLQPSLRSRNSTRSPTKHVRMTIPLFALKLGGCHLCGHLGTSK